MYKNILSSNIEREEAEIVILQKKIAVLDKTIARYKTELYSRVNIVYNVKQNRGEAL